MFRNWWLLALKGALLLIMGAFVLFNAELAIEAIVFYIGLLALIGGVAEVTLAIMNRDRPQWTGYLMEGLLDMGIGILLLTKPGVVILIPVLLGIWIMASGVMLLLRAFRSRREGEGPWANWVALSVLLILIGIWLIYDPKGILVPVTWLMGLVLLAFGVLILLIAFRLRSARNTIRELVDEVKRSSTGKP